MRRSSKQLIADLVAGRSENPTEAMETIVRSPRLLAAYQEQIAAREALSGFEPVEMTESERSDLRRAVWTKLTAAPESRPEPTSSWRAVGAAAAAAVVVGTGALLTLTLSSGGAGEDQVTFSADVSTTRAAAESVTEGDSSVDGGEMAPQAADTEDLLHRYAEIVRSEERTFFALSSDDFRCTQLEELEGLRPVARFDVQGVEYQAWVPADSPDDIAPDTPVTFVDVTTCTVQPAIR